MEEEMRGLPRKAKETVTLETRHRLAIESRVGAIYCSKAHLKSTCKLTGKANSFFMKQIVQIPYKHKFKNSIFKNKEHFSKLS